MATRKIHDLAVVVGKYEQDGETKNKYKTIGVMLEKDDGGRFIILEPWFNPAGVPHDVGRGILVSMFDDKPPREEQPERPAAEQRPRGDIGYGTKPQGVSESYMASQSKDGFVDDIPF